MTKTKEVDEQLAEIGRRVFNSGSIRASPGRSATGFILPASTQRAGNARALAGSDVRNKVRAIVRGAPQVIVRVSGGGKGIRHIAAHMKYISRRGLLELEDENGGRLQGREDILMLQHEWMQGGFPIGETSTRREAINIILSMPAGTSESAVKSAARNFAFDEFHGHQYVMAMHTFDTDPDPDPSPNPHVHLCVKTTAIDGSRLNPRKADLQRWRERFADRLREQGVDCDATRRIHRLQRQPGMKQSVYHMARRGDVPHRDHNGKVPRREDDVKANSEQQLLSGYRLLAGVLAQSGDPGDRRLAVAFAGRLRAIVDRNADRSREADSPRSKHEHSPERG